jgi:hypothetical protein
VDLATPEHQDCWSRGSVSLEFYTTKILIFRTILETSTVDSEYIISFYLDALLRRTGLVIHPPLGIAPSVAKVPGITVVLG